MKTESHKASLRCAVYTRVSTEHGLEQEFNSLDNQREASEAYIKSQAHEGWRPATTTAAFPGGRWTGRHSRSYWTMFGRDRVDVIVVYKVDRLTRSLADFAKLVELFDAHQVSFVSVTQSLFSTTLSERRPASASFGSASASARPL